MNIYCRNLIGKSLSLNDSTRFISSFNFVYLNVNNCRFNSAVANQNRYLTKNSNKNSNKYSDSKSKYVSKKLSRHQTTSIDSKNKPKDIKQSPLFKPIEVKPNTNTDEDDIGISLVGKLEKYKINEILVEFRSNESVSALALESGLNTRMFNESILSFRKYCLQSKTLPVDLHIKLSDIIKKAAPVTDLFPYFLKHTNELYPHLTIMDDLKQISDLTEPSNWYPDARAMKRKVIYHSGPTNSGKTYNALRSFQTSESGIYCGPLKLLANEVFNKTNSIAEAKCDLLTGEERKYANVDLTPANHMACTVEMANLEKSYDVAVIDEIQMIKDQQRGWAWTRAFLGLKAKEIHLCGDSTSIDLISDLCFLTRDDFQVQTYERLTPLHIMSKALESYDKVEPGDCFVCFSKNDIFSVMKSLESKGHEVAVIYGSMPPGVKLAQAARFNDPNDKCKILVATDAIGMGLNLNIRRVIFNAIRKPQHREKKSENDKESMSMEYITPSQALQIAGRAGRFNTAFKDGYVTCFYKSDLPQLLEILRQPLEKTEKAGLHPTADQIELFAYHLPNHSLSDLLKIFMSICTIDDGQYFLCNFDDIISLAEMIDHIPIKLRSKYTFATAPISLKQPFVCSCFVRFVRSYSNNEVITEEYLKRLLDWPLKLPQSLADVTHLENVYDVLDLYLWLGHRFPDIFLYKEQVIGMRIELENLISEGVTRLVNMNKINPTNSIQNNKLFKNLQNQINLRQTSQGAKSSQTNYETKTKYGKLLSYLKKPDSTITLFEKTNSFSSVETSKSQEEDKAEKNEARPAALAQHSPIYSNFANRTGSISNLIKHQDKEIIKSNILDKKSLDKQKLSLIELVRNGSFSLEKKNDKKTSEKDKNPVSSDDQDK